VLVFASPSDALNHLLRNPASRILVADLDTTSDVDQLINFIKSSPLRRVCIVSVGSPDTYTELSPAVLQSIDATLRTPQSAGDLAIVSGTLQSLLANPD